MTPAEELVTVPPVRQLDVYTFRLHLRKRHPRVKHEFLSHHDLDHARNPDLDHRHKEISND